MLQYFVKWKGYPESDNTWEPAQNIHAPDLLKKYHQRYPLQDKKEKKLRKKASSQLRTTVLCRTLQTNPLHNSLTSFRSLRRPIMTRSLSPPNSLSMSLGKSSAKRPSTTRRNRSQSRREPGSTSSTTASAPPRTWLRSLRDSRPPSRTERASTSSVSYSSRSRSPGYGNEPTTAPVTTTPTRSAPTSWQLQSGSASTRGNSQTPLSPADETPANWPNGSDASPTGGRYSTPRTTGLETSPTPSNYMPPSTFPTTHRPRASPNGSLTPLPAPPLPSTLSAGPLMLPSTWGSTLTSSAT